MGKAEEFRQQANICFRAAQRSNSIDDRANWLRMAQSWLDLSERISHHPEGEVDPDPKPTEPSPLAA